MKCLWIVFLIAFSSFAPAVQDCDFYLRYRSDDVIQFEDQNYTLGDQLESGKTSRWFRLRERADWAVRIAPPTEQIRYIRAEPRDFDNRARILDYNHEYVISQFIPSVMPFSRVMDILESNHGIKFFLPAGGLEPLDDLISNVRRRLDMFPPDALPGTQFNIEEQVLILSLAKFLSEANSLPFMRVRGWESHLGWSQTYNDWYLLNWEKN